jgi:hypothetical protein
LLSANAFREWSCQQSEVPRTMQNHSPIVGYPEVIQIRTCGWVTRSGLLVRLQNSLLPERRGYVASPSMQDLRC